MNVAWRNVVSSTVLLTGPGRLYGVVLTSTGVGIADCTIYDGDSTEELRVLKITAPTDHPACVMFTNPVALERGLYVNVGSNVDSVLILYGF